MRRVLYHSKPLLGVPKRFLGCVPIGDIASDTDDPINAAITISHGAELHVKVTASHRQPQLLFVGDAGFRLETTAIVGDHGRGAWLRQDVFHETTGYVAIREACDAFYYWIKLNELETSIGGNVNQENAFRSVVEHFSIAFLAFSQSGRSQLAFCRKRDVRCNRAGETEFLRS